MDDNYLGEIRMVAWDFVADGWAACDGGTLSIADNQALFSLIGDTFGGDGVTTFAVPDLQGRIPICDGPGKGLTPRRIGESAGAEAVVATASEMPAHTHPMVATQTPVESSSPGGNLLATQDAIDFYLTAVPDSQLAGDSTSGEGQSQPHDNLQPYLVVNFILALEGEYPTSQPSADAPMPFMGEIRLIAGATPPAGKWALCTGQLLSISQNTALYSLLGTRYGGDGRTTFALPDLGGRVAMDAGAGRGLTPRFVGEADGQEAVPLTQLAMPVHNHSVNGVNDRGEVREPSPSVSIARSAAGNAYQSNAGGLVPMAGSALTPAGGSQPHNNLQPYLTLNYAIALDGVYPSRV